MSQPSEDPTEQYPPEYFDRQDMSDDALFYQQARLLVHIDDNAISAIGRYFDEVLPRDGVMLDLMSSWRSHLPADFPKAKLVGLGMNDVEMRENTQLDEWIVHDLNKNPVMPYETNSFDAVMVTVSVQYMTRPVEIFADVNRVLKPGATFHVIYSNRMFPTKAVAVWQNLEGKQRAQLIGSYFTMSGGWDALSAVDITPQSASYTDPVYVVRASKT